MYAQGPLDGQGAIRWMEKASCVVETVFATGYLPWEDIGVYLLRGAGGDGLEVPQRNDSKFVGAQLN